MKNTVNKTYAAIGSAFLVLVLSFVVAAFPSQAQACYQGCGTQNNYSDYSCAHPYVYPNGYYYCGHTQTAYQPAPVYQAPVYQAPVYQQPVYQQPAYQPAPVYQQPVYQQPIYQQPVYQQPVYQQPIIQQGPTYVSSNASGLQVGCYSDPSDARINQPVVWNVEVTGGAAPYTYSWTGSDGLTGTGATIIKYYESSGAKNAIVSVTSADGRSTTWACSNTVVVRGSGAAAPRTTPVVVPATPVLGASALFSLNNIPWGWVALLVILVLFATVMYLLFNKTKI